MRTLIRLLLLLCMPSLIGAQTQPVLQLGESVLVHSSVLNEDRVLHVRLPDGYARPSSRFPVLYLTDSETQFLHTVATVQFLARNGRMPEMIVVGITNTDRSRDLTPTRASLKVPGGRAMEFPTSGGADNFLKFIQTEAIPRIESSYRTEPYRVFVGHSFGGLFALHTLFMKPTLFNAVVAESPALGWDDGLMLREAEDWLTHRCEGRRTLYATWGGEGAELDASFASLKDLFDRIRPSGIGYTFEHYPEEDHGSIVLRSTYTALSQIFDGWKMVADAGAAAVPLEAVRGHYRSLSERFGYTVPIPEGVLNQIGYQVLQNGKAEDAVAIFAENVKTYPDSANVYDSLGEAYERSGRADLARESYEKAWKLGQSSGHPQTATFKANLDRLTRKGG